MSPDSKPGFLNRLFRQVKSLVRTSEPADPSRFNDPVALKTAWTPAHSGGANFRTHRLVQVRPDRIEFRPAIGMKLFCGIFLLLGLVVGWAGSAAALSQGKSPLSADVLGPLGFGLLFAGGGGAMYYWSDRPRVFDRRRGYFWKGRFAEDSLLSRGDPTKVARLEEIYALQVLSEWVSGNKTSYYSYELNLILKDGRRLSVVDHGSLEKIREDTKRLADFLNVKIWDAA